MRTVIATLIALLIAPATAVAAHSAAPPPPNDNRTSATVVRLPATLSGTTVGATDDRSDPTSYCGAAHDTVWYRLSGTQPGRIVVRIAALGDLDPVVSVYRPVRSRLNAVGCNATDENGRGALSFTSAGGDYLVMVGRERSSDDGPFKLTMYRQEPSSHTPGRSLPRAGIGSWVEPISDYDDAWSLRMTAGVEYRINLSPARGRCISLGLYRPGTRSFAAAAPVHLMRCGGYFTYTPGFGGSGRYSLLVTASDQRPGRQRYHLQAAVAGPDDTAPRLPLKNPQTRRGTLSRTRGASVALTVGVHFSSAGVVKLEIDRFDPLTGWHFYRLLRLRLGADGRTGISWRPPAIGHWRAQASFHGTRTASPSNSRTALVV